MYIEIRLMVIWWIWLVKFRRKNNFFYSLSQKKNIYRS